MKKMNAAVRAIFRLVLDSSNPKSIAARFRARRLRFILETLHLGSDSLVLDVGSDGSSFLREWQHSGRVISLDNQIREENPKIQGPVVLADLRALPFKPGSIDVIANSVLEHVGPIEEQKKAAAEVRRVGRNYFVQIPYLYFPIDPHFFTVPFFQLLPERWQRRICRLIAVGFVPRGGFLPVHYLTAAEFSALFPEARIVRERFLLLTKSLYAVKQKEEQ